MESLVYFVMAHGTMVITSLLGAIILSVFALLMMSFHNPKESIAMEVGSVERLEGVLRNMLSEQSWGKQGASTSGGLGDDDQVALLREQVFGLEKEVKEKQKMLDEMLNASPEDPAAAPFRVKIKELEEKLSEYSVIEEDIADLTRYRQENENLRNKITQVTGVAAQDALAMPWEEFEKIVKNKKPIAVNVSTSINPAEINKPG